MGKLIPEEESFLAETQFSNPQLEALLSQAVQLRNKLFKNRNFHKHLSKLIPIEAMELHKDFQSFKSLVEDIFLLLPFKKLSSLPESLSKDLNLVQECVEKLRKRLLADPLIDQRDVILSQIINTLLWADCRRTHCLLFKQI